MRRKLTNVVFASCVCLTLACPTVSTETDAGETETDAGASDGGIVPDAFDSGMNLEVTIQASTRSGPVPLKVDFTASVPASTTYRWDFGDGQSSNESNPSHTYIDSGDHLVRLTIHDGNLTLGSATIQITATSAVVSSISLTPQPKRLLVGGASEFPLNGQIPVVIDNSINQAAGIAERVRMALNTRTGVTATIRNTSEVFGQYGELSQHPPGMVYLVLKSDTRISVPLEASGEKMAQYDVQIGTKGFRQGYIIFSRQGSYFVIAESAEGLFYGALTLGDVVEQSATAVPQVVIADYPDLERRIYYPLGHENLSNLVDPAPGLVLLEKMARAKMNGVHLTSGSMVRNFAAVFAPYIHAAKARFIRPILAPSLTVDQSCGVEGFRVINEPFTMVSNQAVPTRPSDLGFTNLDFSAGAIGSVPTGWSVVDSSPTNGEWKLADAASVDGGVSAVLARDSSHRNSRPMLRQVQNVPAGSWVLGEFKVRTENTTGPGYHQLLIGSLDAIGNMVTYRVQQFTGSRDGLWQTWPVHFSPVPGISRYVIWLRPTDALRGTIWVDDIKLTRMNSALANVLLGNGHTFEVKDATSGLIYEEGRDYTLTRVGVAPTNLAHISTITSRLTINRVPTGRIAASGSLLVSFDYLYTQDKLTHANLSPFADCAYDSVRGIFADLATGLTTAGLSTNDVDVFIGQDEIRGFNQDARAIAANTDNISALALRLNRLATATQFSFPNARLYIWADMLDRHQNGADETYQVWWGGKPGMTMPAVFTLPTHVTLIPWWYDTQDPSKVIRESVRTFGRWGFHVAGGAGGNLGNIQYWSAMLHDTGSDFYGHAPFEATLSKEEAIAAFGAYSWRNFDQPVSTIAANHSFELCNGLDDDGDNAIDEDYNLGSDADHCGTCEHSCDMAHGWGQCDAGTCSIAGCVRGFRDLDGQVDNGCEAPE